MICNHQKSVILLFSSTENFLFHFLIVLSSASSWRPSIKPLPPWIAEYLHFWNGDNGFPLEMLRSLRNRWWQQWLHHSNEHMMAGLKV